MAALTATFNHFTCRLTASTQSVHTTENLLQIERGGVSSDSTHLRAKASCASIAVFLPLKGGGLGVPLRLLLNLLGFSILFFLSL